MEAFDALFQPGRIGKLEIKNRIVKSPQSTALANSDGTVSQRTVDHYKRLAEGGIGLVLLEYSFIDDIASKAIHNQLGVSRREHIAGLGWIADEVRAAGAKVGLQIAHGGRQKLLATAPIKSASNVSWDVIEAQYGVIPEPMTLAEIKTVVSDFGDAALRVVKARFDLVEVHAGHGYLITNFLSPHINTRTDEYGGSFTNRARLLLDIVADVRSKIPADFPLSVRLSVTDYEEDGIVIEETVELCRLLEGLGVDVIHASGGHHAGMDYEVSPWYMPRALHQWGWDKIRAAISIPVIGSGSIVSPEVAAKIVGSGSADFVSLGRAMLADPDWACKTQAGQQADIVPCIRCNDGCLHRGLHEGRSAGCTVNPSMGEEYRYPIEMTMTPQTVAVVGGGPAGLNAARVLHERGHQVTLFAEFPLGGQLNAAVRSELKGDLKALRDYLVRQITKHDISVVPGRTDVKTLLRGGFKHIYVATGTTPDMFDGRVAAAVQVLNAADVIDPHTMEGPIIVVGGGMAGCDTALWLGHAGRTDVTLVEAQASIMANDYVFTDVNGMPAQLAKYGVAVMTDAHVMAIGLNEVTVQSEKGMVAVPAKSVLWAGGYKPKTEIYNELRELRGHAAVTLVGTAAKGGRIMDALHHSFFSCFRA